MNHDFDPTRDDILGFIFVCVALFMLCTFTVLLGGN